MYNHTMIIYIECQFHEIPSIAYNVMADDRKSLTLWQSMGNNSSLSDGILMKLHVHCHTMVIFTQNKFNDIQFLALISYGWGLNKSFKFKQLKGNYSSIADYILTKLQVHNPIMVIYDQYQCLEIQSIAY